MNDTVVPLISVALLLVLVYSVISILKPLPPFKRRWQALVCAPLAFFSLGLMSLLMDAPTEKNSLEIRSSETEVIEGKTEPKIESEKIKCDVFDVELDLQNDELVISLDTDCPDYAEIMVSVYRIFYEIGNVSEYSRNYFEEKSTVGNWREQRRISVAHAKWLADLEAHRREMNRLGNRFTVDRISDDIEIRFVVPINQEDERFGHRNSNLVGKAVNTTGLRVVEGEVSVNYPLQGTSDVKDVLPSLNPRSLDRNQPYRISKKTPLMSELDQVNPIPVLSVAKVLNAGSIITVTAVSEMGGRGNRLG